MYNLLLLSAARPRTVGVSLVIWHTQYNRIFLEEMLFKFCLKLEYILLYGVAYDLAIGKEKSYT